MTIVKLLGNGQLALPEEIVKALKLTEGTLLQVELRNGTVTLRPLDRRAAKRRFAELVAKEREAFRNVDPKEIEAVIAAAVAAAKQEELRALKRSKR